MPTPPTTSSSSPSASPPRPTRSQVGRVDEVTGPVGVGGFEAGEGGEMSVRRRQLLWTSGVPHGRREDGEDAHADGAGEVVCVGFAERVNVNAVGGPRGRQRWRVWGARVLALAASFWVHTWGRDDMRTTHLSHPLGGPVGCFGSFTVSSLLAHAIDGDALPGARPIVDDARRSAKEVLAEDEVQLRQMMRRCLETWSLHLFSLRQVPFVQLVLPFPVRLFCFPFFFFCWDGNVREHVVWRRPTNDWPPPKPSAQSSQAAQAHCATPNLVANECTSASASTPPPLPLSTHPSAPPTPPMTAPHRQFFGALDDEFEQRGAARACSAHSWTSSGPRTPQRWLHAVAAPLSATLQFSAPLTLNNNVSANAPLNAELTRKLRKAHKALSVFGWIRSPCWGRRRSCFWMSFVICCGVGGPAVELARKWALVRPALSGSTFVFFEEFVPREYRLALAGAAPPGTLRHLPLLFSPSPSPAMGGKTWKQAQTLNGRPYSSTKILNLGAKRAVSIGPMSPPRCRLRLGAATVAMARTQSNDAHASSGESGETPGRDPQRDREKSWQRWTVRAGIAPGEYAAMEFETPLAEESDDEGAGAEEAARQRRGESASDAWVDILVGSVCLGRMRSWGGGRAARGRRLRGGGGGGVWIQIWRAWRLRRSWDGTMGSEQSPDPEEMDRRKEQRERDEERLRGSNIVEIERPSAGRAQRQEARNQRCSGTLTSTPNDDQPRRTTTILAVSSAGQIAMMSTMSSPPIPGISHVSLAYSHPPCPHVSRSTRRRSSIRRRGGPAPADRETGRSKEDSDILKPPTPAQTDSANARRAVHQPNPLPVHFPQLSSLLRGCLPIPLAQHGQAVAAAVQKHHPPLSLTAGSARCVHGAPRHNVLEEEEEP
ncbi:hypothetical protein B0H16DRAFT_1465686 [Mycena metata]|uniref:Uncharacterized protein n=1 Tax=Mycena metata TaxID=1033252 RepID=A0AAD7IA92_9AGAR|nr:hypothetical protein B0H16DRAFT_1465686 [Mycena metata]